jgi:response regulator of citrate/malate metabolism
MSNKTIEMFTIRQILRLYASGKGTKTISQSTGIARNTIKKYLVSLCFVGERTIEQIEAMSDAQMSRLFLIKEPT